MKRAYWYRSHPALVAVVLGGYANTARRVFASGKAQHYISYPRYRGQIGFVAEDVEQDIRTLWPEVTGSILEIEQADLEGV